MTNFIEALDAIAAARVEVIAGAGRVSLSDAPPEIEPKKLLQVALVNEVSVAELAASWVGATRELDAKLAFARQAGDEAGHFQLVADRLRAHGFDINGFVPPAQNPLFAYLASLATTIERIAGGLFALESIAYRVNENFMEFCRSRGDDETVRLYETIIQPEEREHQAIGRALLVKYATTNEQQASARDVIERVYEIATTTRAAAATKLGVACFPGC